MTLLTVLLLALFVSLGNWQWQRGNEKQLLWDGFANAGPAIGLNPPDLDESPRYLRVAFHGVFDSTHQFLLDNRSLNGKPGYEVLTPARLDDGRRILVNRGWVPFTGYRDRLPDVSLQVRGIETISGRLDELPSAGLASGRAPPGTDDQWPKVTAFPTHEELQTALGEKLARRILLLDPGQDDLGFVRAWQPPGLAPDRHYSYAIQWWGFAVVLLVLYFGLNFRKVN